MFKRIVVGLSLILVPGLCFAEYRGSYAEPNVHAVSEQSGDAIGTAQVSVGEVGSQSNPFLIQAADTDDTTRLIRIQNIGSFELFVGSNTTTLLTSGYQIGAATSTYSNYVTSSHAAIYGTAIDTTTVSVIREFNSIR